PSNWYLRHNRLRTRETIARVRFLKRDTGFQDWIKEKKQILSERLESVRPGQQDLVQNEQKRWQHELRWKQPPLKPINWGFILEEFRKEMDSPTEMDPALEIPVFLILSRPIVPPSCEFLRQEAELQALKASALPPEQSLAAQEALVV